MKKNTGGGGTERGFWGMRENRQIDTAKTKIKEQGKRTERAKLPQEVLY